MDNTLKVELYEGLEKYRRQTDTLSAKKLNEVLRAYNTYHDQYQIDEDKQVYMSQEELEGLQKKEAVARKTVSFFYAQTRVEEIFDSI